MHLVEYLPLVPSAQVVLEVQEDQVLPVRMETIVLLGKFKGRIVQL